MSKKIIKKSQRECTCEIYKKEITKLISFMFIAVRRLDLKYDIKKYKYCPWCGGLLKKQHISFEKIEDQLKKYESKKEINE